MPRKVALKRPTPSSPEKWAAAVSEAKAKFKVYPSAYANAYASTIRIRSITQCIIRLLIV